MPTLKQKYVSIKKEEKENKSSSLEVYNPKEDSSSPVVSMNSLQQLVADGNSPEAVAMKMSIPLSIVKPLHASLSALNRNPVEKQSTRVTLDRHLKILHDAVEQAQGEYAANPTDKNAHALTSLIGASKSLLHSLTDLDGNYSWAKDIDKLIMRPFMEESLKFLVAEINDFLSMPSIAMNREVEGPFKTRVKQMLGSLSVYYRTLYSNQLNELADYCQLTDVDRDRLVPKFNKK